MSTENERKIHLSLCRPKYNKPDHYYEVILSVILNQKNVTESVCYLARLTQT